MLRVSLYVTIFLHVSLTLNNLQEMQSKYSCQSTYQNQKIIPNLCSFRGVWRGNFQNRYKHTTVKIWSKRMQFYSKEIAYFFKFGKLKIEIRNFPDYFQKRRTQAAFGLPSPSRMSMVVHQCPYLCIDVYICTLVSICIHPCSSVFIDVHMCSFRAYG